MWQYLGEPERTRVGAAVERLGATATAGAPFAHVAFEPRRRPPEGPEFVVALRTWPGGAEVVLGSAPPHGLPVEFRDLSEPAAAMEA